MKIATLTASIGPSAGGLFFSVRALSQGLAKIEGNELSVFSLGKYPKDVYEQWLPLPVQAFEPLPPKAYGYAPKFGRALKEYAPDVIHSHGIWMYPSRAAWQASRKTDAPIIVSPRGMLDRWALQNSAWKKRLIGTLFEYRFLREKAYFHALNVNEAESMRDFGIRQPIFVIPNGSECPDHEEKCLLECKESRKKRLLFIGRIHPKKGLECLIRSWGKLVRDTPHLRKEWQLAIAGWDDGGHIERYRALARDQSCGDSLEWFGPTYGEEKVALLKNSDAFILPSFSEGLPMSIIEAWSYGLPVLMTRACNLSEGFTADAAIEIDATDAGVEAGLMQLTTLSTERLREIGRKGRELVVERFTWNQQVERTQEVYEWLLGTERKPSSLFD
ncbi:MAG: glycosyltransferase [Coraliomargaritaceae bacterium]